jgi:predicted RNase H-like nuclease (RuvC/YqgF family)
MKQRLGRTSQVPDGAQPTYSLADLLQEENKRLKKEIERLKAENAELRAKLNGR